VTDDLIADGLRQLLEQIQQELLTHQVAARWNGGASGPVMRPISGGRLAAEVDARLNELAQQVIGLVEVRTRLVPVAGRGGGGLSTLGVRAQREVAQVIVRALPGEITPGDGEEPDAPKPSVISAQRMLTILIILIAILVLREATDLSAHDQSVLMNAIAIGCAAVTAIDHLKVKPPDRKD
jgi:hypothetical protein